MFDDLSDPELLSRCREGVQAAWSVLVRRYQRLIYTIPLRAGLSQDEAADVFQVTFAKLFDHIDRIDDPSRVRAWLVTTAKRETLLQRKRASRIVDVSEPDGDDDSPAEGLIERMADPAPLAEQLLDDLQQQHRVRAAVDRLDPRSRQFVELVFLQDEPLPYQEVARRLGIPEGSIGPTRARCLAKLRDLLKGM